MKIVQGDEQPVITGRNTRKGQLDKRYILTGEDGSPGNFVFGLYYQSGDFYAPRHRHNFDQWRYQIEGEVGFGRHGVMKPGILGYFPEGSYYGPNDHEPDPPGVTNTTVLIQFGGPSGSGYLSQKEVYDAYAGMQAIGRFEDGVFYRNEGVPGKKALDSFQATWEFANGRPLVYPKPQYNGPLMMDTQNYRWMPLDGAPGVEEKALGTFTDCKLRGAAYKLDPGASFTATGRGIYFVLSGRGELEGGPYRQYTALYLETGESATYRAAETSEILLFGLPEIARIRTPLPYDFDAAVEEEEELAEA
jgi:hypothetical protein